MIFNKNSYWLKSGFFSLLQNISSLVFGFGGFYLLVRTISKEDFGGWTLFATTTSLFEVARVGLLKNGFIRYRASSDLDQHAAIFNAALLLNLCFGVSITICSLLFAETLADVWNTPQLKTMFYIYSITSIILVPFFQFEILQHAQLNFKGVFISYAVRNGFLFFGILAGYLGLYTITLQNLIAFHLISALLGAGVSFFLIRDNLRFNFTIQWHWVHKLTHYGKYVIGTSLSAMLYGGVDQFMLGSMVSTSSVAMYSTAGRITNLINIPSMTISTVMFPKSAELMRTEGKAAIKRLYEKSVGTILGIISPCALFVFLFPEFIINIVAGKDYLEAVPVLKVTAFISLLLPFSYQFGTVFDSIGLPNLNFYYTSLSLLTTITLNYFLISYFGMYGAVYGTLLAACLGFLVMQTILRIKLNVNTFNVFKYLLSFYIDCLQIFKQAIISRLR